MDNMLELVKDNPKLAVVRHLCKTPLDVALNPEFDLGDEYYTLIKGKKYDITVVKKDGTTYDASFGRHVTGRLLERVTAFLRDNGILVELSTPIKEVVVWEEPSGSGHLTVNGEKGEYESFECDSYDDAKSKAERFAGGSLKWESWQNNGSSGEKAFL